MDEKNRRVNQLLRTASGRQPRAEELTRLTTGGQVIGCRSDEVLLAARQAGARVPEAIVGMVPTDAEDVSAAVGALKKQFPALFAPTIAGGADAGGGRDGNGTPAGTVGDMNAWLRGRGRD